MNFYPHNIGDYRAATAHLSFEEDAAYRRLLDIYYMTEKPLPLDRKRIHTLTLCQTAKHRSAVDSVLAEFFTKTDDGFRHKRCDQEIAKATEKTAENAEKKDNEKERQKRHRARRREMFETLRGHGVVPPYDTPSATLEDMVMQRERHPPVTRDTTQTQRLTNPNPNPSIEDAADSAGVHANAGAGPTFELVDLALADIAELGSHPVRVNPVIAPILQLVQAGFDLKTQIIPSIRRQIAKAKYPVQRWSYFVQGIVEDAQKIAVKPLEAKPNGSHRPNSIASGFDIIEQAIAAEERAIAEAEGRHGSGEIHPLALPGLRKGAA